MIVQPLHPQQLRKAAPQAPGARSPSGRGTIRSGGEGVNHWPPAPLPPGTIRQEINKKRLFPFVLKKYKDFLLLVRSAPQGSFEPQRGRARQGPWDGRRAPGPPLLQLLAIWSPPGPAGSGAELSERERARGPPVSLPSSQRASRCRQGVWSPQDWRLDVCRAASRLAATGRVRRGPRRSWQGHSLCKGPREETQAMRGRESGKGLCGQGHCPESGEAACGQEKTCARRGCAMALTQNAGRARVGVQLFVWK